IRAVVDAVSEEVSQPRKQLMDGLDDKRGTIAILDIGGVHLGTNQQTRSIGHNVTLTAVNLLGRVVATRPTALGGLDRLTVDDPRRWARFTARRFARPHQQLEIDVLKQAIVSPIVEIALYRRERRKVLRSASATDSRSARYTRSRQAPLATQSRAAGPKAWPPAYAARSAPILHP